ncbi:MAG: chemotaxis protein CheA [Gammaproteobacteria bacterium]|nr:chemotaxis protein CheA [Gammaproteobacteria bacterium]
MDDELLEDFLVEAGEILEQLNEQLVELENRPDDSDLLNAVFRGFHTIKGGAGFLAIDVMVAICHRTEDIFNMLRNDELKIDNHLMDTVLPVLDVLNAQFDALRSGEEPLGADPSLLTALEAIISGEATTSEETAEPVEAESTDTVEEKINNTKSDDISDDEFDALLDALEKPSVDVPKITPKTDSNEITDEEFEALLDDLHGKGQFSGEQANNTSTAQTDNNKKNDEITDDEFEALLDDLHGKGSFSGDVASKAPQEIEQETGKKTANTTSKNSDEITEDEFESLLDDLHGKGKFSTAAKNDTTKTNAAAPAKSHPQIKAEPVAAKKEPIAITDKPKPAAKEVKPAAETSVRVDTSRLDEIMNMVGELVLVRNRISRLGSESGDSSEEEMTKAIANLDLVTADLQLSVMKTRMQPIKKVFGRFPRVVRDLARSLNKDIKLEMIGEDTDLDKNLVEALADPLVHLVRNSVDHGVEMPDEREKVGKPRQGTVTLSASQEGDHILLSITDDGGGMDADVLRNIAINKGIHDKESASRLTDVECYNLIFAPGFSTKQEISDISGRGVGMDVVKTSITSLNGSIEIDSKLGEGTIINIKVPLTLAIMSTLMVKLKDQLFSLPLVNVNEIFHLDLTKTNVMDGKRVVLVRGKTLPLYYLNNWLVNGESNAPLPDEGHVVVVHIGTQKVGFIVDELIGQEEVVIKPLGAMLHGISGLAGATITGDGGIALILDIPGLMKMYA